MKAFLRRMLRCRLRVMPVMVFWQLVLGYLVIIVAFACADMRKGIPLVSALMLMVYGAYRGLSFHPGNNVKQFLDWTRGGPWTPGNSPFYAPHHPVWQDGIILAIICTPSVVVITLERTAWPPVPVCLLLGLGFILAGATISLLLLLFTLNRYIVLGFMVALAIGAASLRQPSAYVAAWLTILTCSYLTVRHAYLRLTVLNLPGEPPVPRPQIISESNESTIWLPCAPIAQGALEHDLRLRHRVLFAAFVGWFSFAVVHFNIEEENCAEVFIAIFSIVALLLIGVRLAIYTSYGYPPLSLLGRIALRRLILPGYDVIFVAPAFALLLAVACVVLMRSVSPIYFPACLGISATLVLILLTCAGPSLAKWRLTGQHRIPLRLKFGLSTSGYTIPKRTE